MLDCVSLTHWTCSTVRFISLGMAQIWQHLGLHPMQETPPTETVNSGLLHSLGIQYIYILCHPTLFMNNPSESLHSKTIYAIIFIGSISFHLYPVTIMKLDASAHYNCQIPNLSLVWSLPIFISATYALLQWLFFELSTRKASCGFSQGHGTTQVALDKCFLACQMGFVLRELWSERGQNIYLKLHIDVSSFFSASHHLPVSARLFCDRISLFPVFCAPQWHFHYFSSHFESMSVRRILPDHSRVQNDCDLYFVCGITVWKIENGRFSRIMDHWFDILLSAFVFIYINVTNCYSAYTVMRATDILLHGLLNRSLTMCRTESSVLWVILAKSCCCFVLDVCVSGFRHVQRRPPLTDQTWAPAADWGALIFLIHLGAQCFAITFNNVLYLLKRLHMHDHWSNVREML